MTAEQIDAAEGAAVSTVLTPEERYLIHESALGVLFDVAASANYEVGGYPLVGPTGEGFDGEPVPPTRDDLSVPGEEALVRIEAALVVAFERGKAARS